MERIVTTDHELIRRWVERRGGKPAVVAATRIRNSGLLRIDFAGHCGADTLEQIEWEDFFRIFDERKMAFLYQETTKVGVRSRFCKILSGSSASTESQRPHLEEIVKDNQDRQRHTKEP